MSVCMIRFILFLIIFMPGLVFSESPTGFGGVATNLMEPVIVLSDFVSSTAIIIGAIFIFSSFLKYLQYRVNPLAVPISTVVFLLICGIVLVLLPLTYKLVYSLPPYQTEFRP